MRSSFFLPAAALCVAVSSTAVQAQDAAQWQGGYAGFATNIIAPEIDYSQPFVLPLQEGTGFGVFGGYNYAIGDQYVIGAELGYNLETDFDVQAGVQATMDNSIMARGRFGYATGNVLLYGTVGYINAEFSFPGGPSGETASGPIYGIGLEALLLDNFSFRIDYTSTHMNPEGNALPGGSEIDANSVSLGAAFHF